MSHSHNHSESVHHFSGTHDHAMTDANKRIEDEVAHHQYHEVFKDLQELRKFDKEHGQDFNKDLKAINDQLHKDGYLPGLEITENKDGFDLKATGQAPAPEAPPHYNPPAGGYSGGGGNFGGGGGGYGGGMGFGGDVGGDGGTNSNSGSSEGGSLPASGPGAFNNYDGSAGDMSPEEQAALAAAEQSMNQEMWTNFPAASAEEGCAASVSQILDNAGVAHLTPGQGDALCSTMQQDLMKQGWTVTDKPKPGDVVIGYGGLSSAHTGIVGKNGMVMDNHSSTGRWSQDHLSYFSNWNKVVFLTPPSHTASAPAAKHG